MENEITQQICVACEQVITLSEPMPEIEYCFACTEDINAHHDAQPDPTDAELEDWASQYDDDPNPYAGTYSEI